MRRDPEMLDRVFSRTDGICHLCGKRLVRKNYGKHGARGAWQIEHSRPKAQGGHPTHLNNLFPACIACNLKKGTKSSRSARAHHGRTRSPLSPREKKTIRAERAAGGSVVGAVVGGILAGPAGAAIGAGAGGWLGHSLEAGDPGRAETKRCRATLRSSGKPCRNKALPGNHGYCGVHRR